MDSMDAITWVTTDVGKEKDTIFSPRKSPARRKDPTPKSKGSHLKGPKSQRSENSDSDNSGVSKLQKKLKKAKLSKARKAPSGTTKGSSQRDKKKAKSESKKKSKPKTTCPYLSRSAQSP